MNHRENRTSLAWRVSIVVLLLVPALCTFYALWMAWQVGVSWRALALFAGMYFISGFGITVGFHRMLTHRGFEAPAWLRASLVIAGAMAFQGSPIDWVAGHVEHHSRSDRARDPHSPRDGFWHAHAGWLFNHHVEPERFAKHLLRDPLVVALDRVWLLWALLGLAMPFALGGVEGLLWGGAVRIFAVHHATWCVNSVCHTFGARDHDTHDMSTNNFWVALITFGEGWHNNHHANPACAFHGQRWYEVDWSGSFIRMLAWVGLAWNVRSR